MIKNVKKHIINIYKLKDTLMKKKPMARQTIEEDSKIVLDGVELPSVNMEGEMLSHLSFKEYIREHWEQYFRLNTPFQCSDLQYIIFNKVQMQILAMETYKFMKEFLPIEWNREITDCDDFMYLYKGLFALVLYNSGVRNCGSGVGAIKIKNSRGGHALNFTLINDDYTPYFIEPQNGTLYKLGDKSTEIFFLDI